MEQDATNLKPWTQQIIAYALVFSFISVIYIWMVFPPKVVDQAALTVVNMLLGALVAKFTTIIDFFFGSSQGSKDKDDTQNKLINAMAGTGSGAGNSVSGIVAKNAAEKAAPAAAAAAAPPAAAVAAPPAADIAAPPAAKAAVAEAMAQERTHPHDPTT